MIEVSVIDGASGEAESMQLLTTYLSDRLFTSRQRKTIQVFVDLTPTPLRVPVTRAMLMPRRSGLRTLAPCSFEMTVSTAAGIRHAGEVLAHEMIHISQVINGRLVLKRITKKVDGSKATVDLARWMGGKPVIIDQLEWRHRPWEIEACYWQTMLVDEFLTLAGGNKPVQQLQKPGKRHLALFEAALSAPQVSQGNLETPLDIVCVPAAVSPERGANAIETADQAATGPAASPPSGTSRIADNAASIDALLNTSIPPVDGAFGDQATAHQVKAQSAVGDMDSHAISAATMEAVFDAVEPQADDSLEDMSLSDSAPAAPANKDTSQLDGTAAHGLDLKGSDLNGAQMNGSFLNGTPANRSGTNCHRPATAILASDNVMRVIVPGLESPRPLHLESLVAKRRDLQQRGLLNG